MENYKKFQTMLQKRTWIQMQRVRDQYSLDNSELEMLCLKTILERDLFRYETEIKFSDYINALRVDKIIEGKGSSNRRRKIREFNADQLQSVLKALNKRSINSLFEEWLIKRNKK